MIASSSAALTRLFFVLDPLPDPFARMDNTRNYTRDELDKIESHEAKAPITQDQSPVSDDEPRSSRLARARLGQRGLLDVGHGQRRR
jgi:hypothetical protein